MSLLASWLIGSFLWLCCPLSNESRAINQNRVNVRHACCNNHNIGHNPPRRGRDSLETRPLAHLVTVRGHVNAHAGRSDQVDATGQDGLGFAGICRYEFQGSTSCLTRALVSPSLGRQLGCSKGKVRKTERSRKHSRSYARMNGSSGKHLPSATSIGQ